MFACLCLHLFSSRCLFVLLLHPIRTPEVTCSRVPAFHTRWCICDKHLHKYVWEKVPVIVASWRLRDLSSFVTSFWEGGQQPRVTTSGERQNLLRHVWEFFPSSAASMDRFLLSYLKGFFAILEVKEKQLVKRQQSSTNIKNFFVPPMYLLTFDNVPHTEPPCHLNELPDSLNDVYFLVTVPFHW